MIKVLKTMISVVGVNTAIVVVTTSSGANKSKLMFTPELRLRVFLLLYYTLDYA